MSVSGFMQCELSSHPSPIFRCDAHCRAVSTAERFFFLEVPRLIVYEMFVCTDSEPLSFYASVHCHMTELEVNT